MELAAVDPKVLGLAAILIPLITSFLKSVRAPDWLQSTIYGVLCLLASVAAFVVKLNVDGIPAAPQARFDWWLGALLQILVVSQAFYRGVWKPSGADAVVAKHTPPQLGENLAPSNNAKPLPEEAEPPRRTRIEGNTIAGDQGAIELEDGDAGAPVPFRPRADNEDPRWEGN